MTLSIGSTDQFNTENATLGSNRNIQSPAWSAAIVAISILAMEVVLMFAFQWLPPFSALATNILDGVLLTVLVSPILYLFLFRPLNLYIAILRQAQATLLQHSEEHYRKLFYEATDAIALADFNTGELLDLNYAMEKLVGRKKSELVGKPQKMLHPFEPGADPLHSGFEQHRTDKEGQIIETQIITKSGEIREVEIKASSMVVDGRMALIGFFRDITERKRLQQQLDRRLRHRDVMERITQISMNSASIEELMERVLDEMLAVFDADRAWFLYPCDPDAPFWSVPMERTRPEWPGVFARGLTMPMTPEVAEVFREVLAATMPLSYGAAASRSIPAAVAEQFSIRSQIQMALRPREGSTWTMGLHHCAQARAYDEDELQIFKDIGERVADALSSMITLKNLRASEESLKRAQAVGQIGSWILDIPTTRLELSAETYRMFGISQQQPIRLEAFVAVIHADDRDFVHRAWGEAMAGAPYDIEHRIVVEGQTHWVRERAQIERDAQGRALRGIGTVQDITERKQQEEKLRRKEEVLLLFVEHSPAAIAMCDHEMKYIAASRRFSVDYGLGEQNLVGRSHYDVFPEIPERWKEIHRRCLAGSIEKCDEDPFPRANGNIDWVRWEIRPWNQSVGVIGGIIMFSEVITERKHAELELRLYGRALDASMNSIVIADAIQAEHPLIFVNPAFTSMTGYSAEEVLGKRLRILLGGDWEQPEIENIRSAVREKRGGQAVLRNYRKDGSLFWHELYVSPVWSERGEVTHFIGVGRDITLRKQAEQDLEESRIQLRGLMARREEVREEERKYIAREVHDELGQILTGLQLNVSVITHKFAAALPSLHEHLQETMRLTNSALSATRNVASALRPSALDMGIVSAIEWLTGRFGLNTGIHCEVHIGETEIRLDESYAIALFRIIQESLTNVARHAQADKVDITLDKDVDDFVLKIRDNGMGFDMSAKKEGSFGLVGIRERAIMLNGRVFINSQSGSGTEIVVRIPVNNAQRTP